MSERKSILLRLDPAVHDALADAGRLPGKVGAMRRPGRPPRASPPG